MEERARRALASHGWELGPPVGFGVEGTVFDLAPEVVAKIWKGRSSDDVRALSRFMDALGRAGLPFPTPHLLEVIESPLQVISVERRLRGRPVRRTGQALPLPVSDGEGRIMGDVLEALSGVEPVPALSSLPILPGYAPFDPAVPFPESLALLVAERFDVSRRVLRRDLGDDVDAFVGEIVDRLDRLPRDQPVGLIHGDLIPANVLLTKGEINAVLDFGFLTALGDPQFDAAVTASTFDMYGPNAAATEAALDHYFTNRFGHQLDRYHLYRAAYAVITATFYSSDGQDGHFKWCVRMLRRPAVRRAVLEEPCA